MGKAKHFIAVAVLVVLATLFLRLVFGTMFQLPYGESAGTLSVLQLMGFQMPNAAAAEAVPIDGMFNAHYWMISFLFGLIMVLVLYSVFVFRRKPDDTEDGPHIHSNTMLEVGWTIVPTVIVIGFGIYGAVVLNDVDSPNEGEMTVKVQAQQWAWSFQYPEQEDVQSAQLVLPVNQPVVLEMESADVIHSFWVPEFRVKKDLVPGQMTTLRVTPTEEGEYKLRCAEICGAEHAQMLADVRVVGEDEFAQFIEESKFRFADLTPEERGELWYSNGYFGCEACHSLDGSDGVGPTWQGLYLREEVLTDGTVVVADEEYIRSSILEPNNQIVEGYASGVMPQNYGERFAAQEEEILASEGVEIDIIDDLIAFIKTLEE